MQSLESELAAARDLDVADLADAIESIGFECTRCGGCCTGYAPGEPGGAPPGEGVDETEEAAPDRDSDDRDSDDREPHTATVFPDEVRRVADAAADRFDGSYDWRDVARPMPFGLDADGDGEPAGETFEWALATDDCGDCTFYEESDGRGACTVHDARPLICRTYPFSVALDGTSQPMGEAVDESGVVRAHECEGLGRDISREDAEELAAALKERAVRELEEAIGVRDGYDPSASDRVDGDIVVFDSEGPKEADGTPVDGD
ncbi:YkgJ family cysteine cluster protein [Halorubrum sp. BOL3-1]|uniref:YkgJ family cysteine cluster protein n=1 Tax=Halorubrum sp. BOL3-1 TaxID=2497325 RepID=UPI0010051A1B|nr:YkgJ family cysteine cluster protein [Halorubrum sp. BOL3-1]QAU12796.1 YkgJ family cysteine cluster protein [Halorubrum sp. BOL3-1]